MTKRLLAVLLALLIVVGCLPVAGATGAGSEFSDMPDNWSTVALKSAVANGLLIGDNGKIIPENPLTRAQMATIIVRAFGATEEGDISAYTDVKSTDWFASSIAKAYKMGVMEGYAGKMNPDNNITREQAFAVLARALKLEPASKCNKTFEDISNVSEWATGEVYAMVNAGYIQGANGKLNPQSNIRRNEFAQVMYNLMQQYIVQEGEYTEAAEGNVMVNVPGVTLKGLTVKGDLIIGDGVGDGNVILDDVVVTGRLVIRGGGKNSIIICGSSDVSNVIATRVDGAVRVKVEGNAKVETIYVDDGSDDIIIVGSVGSVEVAAGNVTVTATGANIGSANISGSGSALIVDSSSKVDSVSVTATNAEVDVEGSVNNITTSAANTSVTGKGSVNKVEVKQGADGAKIETPKTEITVSEGVSDVTAGGGTKVESGSTVTNNGNGTGVEEPSTGGGGGGPITVEVSAISVEVVGGGEAVVGAKLAAVDLEPEGADVDYQWQKADAEDGEYVDIDGATASTYQLTEADKGKWIRVKVTGTGNYTGTKTSNMVGPVEAAPVVEEVFGSMTAYGDGVVEEEDNTYTATFTGEIPWYEANEGEGVEFPRAEGNRVGVKIFMPEDEGYDPADIVEIKIGDNTYEWEDIKDGEDHFQWWPLVTEAGEEFTATIKWNSASEQTFVIKIADDATLADAPDTTAPELVGVSPEAEDVNLAYDETFKLEVTASDENLYELEVDHSFEGTLPEFSVYASESDPYGGQGDAFEAQGVNVTYDAEAQKWTIDFGEEVTNQIVDNEGITFYLVLVDEAGNKWGSMDPTTEENTFAYTVTQEPAPEASTYKFSYKLPEEVIAGEEYTVPVTIEPETVGDFGYDKVRFNVEVTTPDGATLQLLATDDTGTYDVAEIGYWGPENGFPIDENYSADTDFTAIFSDDGDYTITFSLLDLDADETLVTETVEITVSEAIETIAANVDYNAVWNESRGTWYIKVTVPDENLDAGSVKSIHAITEAGVDLDEPRELTPDTDTVMWFGVAKGDGEVTLKRDGKYAYKVVRTDGSEYIFSFTYASGSVTGATNLVQAALDKVNTTVVTDRGAAYELVMEVAEILGLNVDGDFAGLVQGRAEAAAKDLLDNRGDGYDLATIRAAFDEIVATRLVFEQSVALFSAASETNPLTDLTYITMLIENLENVEYQTIHSGKNIEDEILPELKGLVADFNALTAEQQETVLKDMNYSATTSSTATRNALRAAITQVLADEEAAIDAALDAVNEATTADELKAAIEGNAAKLGLATDSESEYGKLKTYFGDRQRSVSVDLLANKPDADGYNLATLQEYFNAIVATRHATQDSMDKVNDAESAEDLGIEWVTNLQARFDAAAGIYTYHSGVELTAKASELEALVGRYNDLPEENQKAALQEVLDNKPEDGYSRSGNTIAAFETAIATQEGIIEGAIDAALAAVNAITGTADDVAVIKENAKILGLDLTAFEALDDETGQTGGRQTAVMKDLVSNKGEGYDQETLKAVFDSIVAVRTATQESMDLVNEAESLENINYVEDLLAAFESVAEGHTIHSGKAISEKVTALEGLVADFEALPEANQEAALAAVITNRPEGGYLRSQSTLDALADAIAEQEGEIEGEEDESDN